VTPAIKYYLFAIFFSFTLNNSLSLSKFVATQSSNFYTFSFPLFLILSDQPPPLTRRQILSIALSRSSSSAFLLLSLMARSIIRIDFYFILLAKILLIPILCYGYTFCLFYFFGLLFYFIFFCFVILSYC